MNAETRGQLRELAQGDSFAAFKSAARACGLADDELEAVWSVCQDDDVDEVVFDVRESGAELRSSRGWLTSSLVVEAKR